MRKLINLVILVPIAVVLIVLSVANRQTVTLSLDPFNMETPVLSLSLPFFVFLFGAVLAGMVLGSIATWFKQSRYRQGYRDERDRAEKARRETEELRKTIETKPEEIAPGLPAIIPTKNAA